MTVITEYRVPIFALQNGGARWRETGGGEQFLPIRVEGADAGGPWPLLEGCPVMLDAARYLERPLRRMRAAMFFELKVQHLNRPGASGAPGG